MEINEEALKLAVKAIEAEPSTWQQNQWAEGKISDRRHPWYVNDRGSVETVELEVSCGTRMCLAGYVTHQAGWVPIVPSDLIRNFADSPSGTATAAMCRNPETGEVRQIKDLAQDILGVSWAQAQALFHSGLGNKDVHEFKRQITEYTGVTFDKE